MEHILLGWLPFTNPSTLGAAVCTVGGKVVDCPMYFEGLGAFFGFNMIFLPLFVLMIVSQWMIYKKAGQPGWAVLIPIYNIIVLLKIINRPWWWIFLMFIPLVNIIVFFIIYLDLAKSFGKGFGFALGLLFISIVFFPILAFGSAQYAPIIRN